MVSASCGIEPGRLISYKPLLDAAIELVDAKPERCLILQRPELEAELDPHRDVSWTEAVADAEPVECVPVDATDPLYILYTSGTTGQAKGIVRDTGGHAVALKWSMKNVYDVEPGEVYWAASDVGWVVGHSYIVYGPLLHGCTTVLYEGKPVGTPDPGAFWRVISEHGVSTMFTAPTAFRAIRQQDPEGAHIRRYDLSRFRALFLAGERCDPETLRWAQEQLGVPVIDHWWQTETGWAIAANCIGIEHLPVVPGSPTRPAPGWDLKVLDADGDELPANQTGALVVRLPMPPGASPTLWNADERFRQTYLSTFPGYYETADAGYIDEAGYVFVMARTDDIINVAGHRLSTGAIEEVDGRAPGCRRVRRDRSRRRAQGPAARRLARPQGGRGASARGDRRGGRADGPRSDRRRRGVQDRDRRRLACRRRVPGRSCERRCARSPMASSTRSPPRSTIPPSSARSARRSRRSGTRARPPTSNRMPSGSDEDAPERKEPDERCDQLGGPDRDRRFRT